MSSETGSNNPFSVNNVHKELAMTATSNPFQNTGAANNVQTPALMMSGSFAAQPAPTGNFQPGYTGMGMMQMSPTGFHPFQPQHAPTQMQLQQQARHNSKLKCNRPNYNKPNYNKPRCNKLNYNNRYNCNSSNKAYTANKLPT